MYRVAWQATVHGVTKSQTRLSDEHFHFFPLVHIPPPTLPGFLDRCYLECSDRCQQGQCSRQPRSCPPLFTLAELSPQRHFGASLRARGPSHLTIDQGAGFPAAAGEMLCLPSPPHWGRTATPSHSLRIPVVQAPSIFVSSGPAQISWTVEPLILETSRNSSTLREDALW